MHPSINELIPPVSQPNEDAYWMAKLAELDRTRIEDGLVDKFSHSELGKTAAMDQIVYMRLMDPTWQIDSILPTGWRELVAQDLRGFDISPYRIWLISMLHKTCGFTLAEFGVDDSIVTLIENAIANLISANRIKDAARMCAWLKLMQLDSSCDDLFFKSGRMRMLEGYIRERVSTEETLKFILCIKINWPERFANINLDELGIDSYERYIESHVLINADEMKLRTLALMKLVLAPKLDLSSPTLVPLNEAEVGGMSLPGLLIY